MVYSVVGWFDRKKGQKINMNPDYTQMSDKPQQGGGSASGPAQAHSGSTPKSEPTEEDSRVPREEARASRDCAAAPPTWDNDDKEEEELLRKKDIQQKPNPTT
eukprot:5626271-Amphidinium_carterae.2